MLGTSSTWSGTLGGRFSGTCGGRYSGTCGGRCSGTCGGRCSGTWGSAHPIGAPGASPDALAVTSGPVSLHAAPEVVGPLSALVPREIDTNNIVGDVLSA